VIALVSTFDCVGWSVAGSWWLELKADNQSPATSHHLRIDSYSNSPVKPAI